ncbi:MAG TPA: BtuF-related (seleno)protein, partial [Candidatus Sulfotelmatobacter sp.]|nr:BtuF-related (seleno)protein [Candidatus Sulfotelmatobacter sp.]
AARPDVIVIMPCGYSLASAKEEFRNLPLPGGWNDLPAVRDGRAFVVEASGYFSRPGPRLPAGLAILANAIHSGTEVRMPLGDAPQLFTRVASASVGAG